MPNNNNRINFQVGYNVDQASVNAVKKSLQDLQNIKFKDFNGPKKDLDDIKQKASQVEAALNKAFNVNLNSLNTQSFNTELQKAGLSIDKIYSSFSKAGAQGQVAFSRMASEVLTTNMQLKLTNSLVSQMGETMANTVKWGIASSVMNNFTNSVRQAFDYVKALDSSLNDIRIVTKQSSDLMANFAVQANNAAQSLGRSTMDYTKAALTFYQQGLDEASVQARTESVLKAQNITGAGDEMADYLTAVWNGYKVANEEAELYVDKLAAVADSSASNMSLLAIAMSKVASSANLLGVPVDNLNAQIATIVATTRQAPESVGNALKTIYSRINDIATGADDAEISLGNYSSKMALVGISVLDANGRLRDTGDVIDEIGGKWETLSHEQQIYLARTMAGQRQYNNLLALFENWGKYSDLVNVSMEAQGATALKNAIYMESLSAKMEQLGAAGEKVKAALIDEDDLKGLVDFGTGAVNLFGNLILSIGGGKGALLAFGSIFTQVFSGIIAKEINNAIVNAQNYRHNLDLINAAINKANQSGENSFARGITTEYVQNLQQMQKYWSALSNEQKQEQQDRANQINTLRQLQTILKDNIKQANLYALALTGRNKDIQGAGSNSQAATQLQRVRLQLLATKNAAREFENTWVLLAENINATDFTNLSTQVEQLVNRLGRSATKLDYKLVSQLRRLSESADASKADIDGLLDRINELFNKVLGKNLNLQNILNPASKLKLNQIQAEILRYQKEFDAINQGARQAFDTKAVVNFAAGLGQVASGINNIKNLGSIWSRDDLSTGLKMIQTMTNIGMTIPMLVNGLKLMKTSWGGVTDSIKLAATQIMVRNGAIIAADAGAEAALMSLATAIKTVTTSILASPLAPFIAVAAAVGVAIYAMYKLWNRLADAAKKAALVAQETKKTYDDLKSSYDNLKSSLENYNSAQEAISEMTKGTQEWRDAIRESNDAVLELIRNYPELASLVLNVNGKLILSESAQQEALLKATAAIDNVRLANVAAESNSRDANLRASAREASRFVGVASYNANGQDGFRAATTNLVMRVIEAYFEITAKSNLEYIAAITKSTGMLEEMVSAIVNGTKNIDQLAAELRANTLATRLAYLTIAAENLQDNPLYDDLSELGKQVADSIAGADLKALEDSITSDWIDKLTDGVNILSGAGNKNVQEMLAAFNKAQGTSWGLDSNAVRGTDTNRTFAFLDEQGELVLRTALQVASTIAASQALEEMGNSAQEASNFLLKLGDLGFGSAIQSLISGGDFKNLTESELALAQLEDLEKFYNLNEEILSKFFNDSNSFIDAFKDKTQEATFAGRDYVASMPGLSTVFDAIVKDKNLTGNIKESIAETLVAGFKDGGPLVAKELKGFYDSISDISAFERLSEGLDFSTLNVERFTKELKLAGIETNATTELLLAYINAKKELIQPLRGAENLNTLGLLGRQASGEKLSDEESELLQSNLRALQNEYSNLIGAVEILNSEWLSGTMMYQRALHDVNNQLLETAQYLIELARARAEDSQNLSDAERITAELDYRIAVESTSQELTKYIQDVETLQNALGKQLLTTGDYSITLERLASKYESCSTELNAYLLALNSGDEQTVANTEATLLLSLRAAELAEATGLEADRIEMVAASLARQNPELQNNSELAADAAARYIKLNEAIANLYDNAENYRSFLEEIQRSGTGAIGANEELFNSFQNIKQVVADVFDTDSNLLGDDWIVDHLELIILMAESGGLGLEELRKLAAEEILLNLGIDFEGFDEQKEAFLEELAGLEDGADLMVEMSLDDIVFLQQLVTAMLQAGYSQGEIEKALSGMNIDVDLAPYEAGLNEAIDRAIALEQLDPLIQPDVDLTNYEEGLNAAANQASEAGAIASDSFAENAGVDVKTKTQTISTPQETTIPGQEYDVIPKTGLYTYPLISLADTGFFGPMITGVRTRSVPVQVPQFLPRKTSEVTSGEVQAAATGLLVIGAHKSSGGNVSHYNSPGARNSRSPSKGKGGGGGGGGGRKVSPATQAKTSTAKIDTQPKVSTPNPYEQEEKSYDRQSKILDLLQNQLKKLVNKDRLKNLQQQNKVLEKQKDILQAELDISANSAAENSTADYARRLKQAFKDISFDKDGQIADINKIQAENASVYNAAAKAAADAFEKEKENYNNFIENTWNKYATKDLQEAHKNEKELWDERIKNAENAAKEAIKDAELVYKEREDLIKSYNDAWKDDQDRLKEYNELTLQIYDNLIAISKVKVDLSIDTGEFERDWLNFENKFIKKLDKDDFLGNAKASAKELMSYFNSKQVQLTANQIKKIRDLIAIMNAGGTSNIYGTNLAQAQEDLEEYMKQQMDDLLLIQDLVDNIKDNYLDAINDARDKMDDQIDQYERINDLVEHNMKMVLLLYGDKAYDSMLKYYNLQQKNNESELESLKKQQDYWKKKMDNEVVGSDAWKKFKDNLDDATDDLNSKLEDMIDNLSDKWLNRVNGIIAKLNNALTGGRGLDYLDEQWDYINNYDDQFLDTFESKTGIDEVERLYQSTIDGLAGSPKSQQALNKLMNDQLKLLRLKDHLTEYDLERAKASLEVEKARLALEEARDNKTKMRLRRDSQGNYTYQYVADELKLGDLQAALADAQANLYNTDKEHYKQNLNNLYDTYKDYILKMRDLTEEYNNTQDEEERKRIQARIDLLKESTNKIMNGLNLDNKYLLQYLNGSFFDGMGVDTSTLTMEEQMLIMEQNIPQMQSNIQDLANTIVGQGGILNATADAMKEINDATLEYDKNVSNMLTSAGTSLLTIEQAVDREGNALDKNITNAEKLITTNDELIKSCQSQIDAMEKLLDYMDKYLNKIMNVLTLLSNLRSAYNTGQNLNGSNLTADNIGMENWELDTTSGMEYTGNPATDAAAVKRQIDALMAQYEKFLAGMSIATFDTGGYTGSWGDAEGRLAFLHQGELVLNQDDTRNILSAVLMVRSMANAINGFASGEINSLMSNATGLLGGISNTEQLDQNVHIEANFPNVTQHTEIEQAFNNLVNMASMRASGYRD